METVNTALDYGINLFDTAPYYGATRGETVLGRALKGVPRDRYLLATKVGRYGSRAEDFDFSPERVLRSIDESRLRLGVDYIDCIQVHDIEFGDIEKIIEETLPALRRAKDAGSVRYVGVSGLHVHLLARVVERCPIDFVQSYCHGTLYDSTLMDWLPIFRKAGVGVFNSAPLGMRLLADAGPPAWHPAPERLKQACRQAVELCRLGNVNISELALHYSLNLPGVDCTIIGASHPQEIINNSRVVEAEPNKEVLNQVLSLFNNVRGLSWPSGRPENQP